ncbi:MAG: hypothetical protein GWM87_00870 [Xanthomonadales bacterium]|nr:urate hydroxylase PuuD [Xanthomonadales bacterium]NIX11646.1 hypothetical protein [Xanthomonadales bacterium]
MEAHLHAWISLLIRWAHFIVGIAWIGASFYFNWLENRLRRANQKEGVAGDLWAIHGGGFYYLKKYAVAPPQLPGDLHWFKWEAYATWLTGFALLVTVFYLQAGTYMVDGRVEGLTPALAIAIGIGSLALSWLFYDTLCRSPLAGREVLIGGLAFAWFTLLAWLLGEVLSGRAAFIHVGAAAGTVMVANVFRVIIPAQKELVSAMAGDREPDAGKAAAALQRSRHNNYFTLPVLFIMISSHFPATYGHQRNWLVLVLLSLSGIAVRHYFNIRHLEGSRMWPLLPAAVLLALAVWISAPGTRAPEGGDKDRVNVVAIVQERCAPCHSATPVYPGFTTAPLGIELDTAEQVNGLADRIYQASSVTRTMPLGNVTQMSDSERRAIADWYSGREQ